MRSFLRIFPILAAALLGLGLLFSCEKPQPVNPNSGSNPGGGNKDPEVELAVSMDKLSFSSYGGSRQITVTTNQGSWSVKVSEGAKEWISVSVNGAAVTVSVPENAGSTDRQGTVTVSAGGKTIDVPVKQEGAAGLPSGGENITLSYTLSEGTVVAPKALASYITSHDKGLKTFTVSKSAPKDLLPAVPCNLIVNTPTDVLPQGLLCNVWSMEEGADGYVFYYNDVDFTSVFKELNLDTDEIDLAEYVTEIKDAEGNDVPFTKTKAATKQSFHIELPQAGWDLPGGFSLTPKMTLDIALKLQMIVGDYKISTLNVKVDTEAEIGADLELMVEVGDEKYFKLLSVYVAAIPLGPVVLTPSVDIYAMVGVDGKIGLSASASTVLRTSASLHYDEINGLSGETSSEDPEPGETKYSASPKVEAGFYYGLGVGPAIGLFTDIIQTGITLNLKRREAISTSINFAELVHGPDAWITESWANAEYSVSWLVNAALHLRAFGMTHDESTPDVTVSSKNYKVFPPIAKEYELMQGGGANFTVKTQVTAPSIFPGSQGDPAGELVLCLVEKDNALATEQVFPFDMDDQKAAALWEDPKTPQTIEATASGLLSGRKYRACIAWRYGDLMVTLLTLDDLLAIDGEHQKAIRGILSDIMACGAGEWEGCNWDEQDNPLTRLKNVNVGYSTILKEYLLDIDLPADWKLGRKLTVSNRSSGIDDMSWRLKLQREAAGQKWEFDKIAIDDQSFENLLAPDGNSQYDAWANITTKTFQCRSPRSRSFPITTEEMDISGSGVFYLYAGEPSAESYYGYVPMYPSKILADNCPELQDISIWYPDGKSLGQLSARNCPLLRGLELRGAIHFSPETLLGQGEPPEGGRSLILDCPGEDSVTIGSGWTTGYIWRIGTVTVSGARDLQSLGIGAGVVNLSIADCPKMESLIASFANDGDLESFSISGTPKINKLYINGNRKLKAQVPAVFDEIRSRDGALIYDVRYEYVGQNKDKGSTYYDISGTWRFIKVVDYYYMYYRDCGYGFSYDGEPSRAYHLK